MPIYRLQSTRTQWASGHGFFHSGEVRSEASRIAYGYDCGSLRKYKNSLTREIAAFRSDELDLMFISHFDYDHVSGVPTLADKVPVQQFVIPLTTVHDRFLRVVAQLDAHGDDWGLDASDEWFWRLLADPVSTLAEYSRSTAPVLEVAAGTLPSPEFSGERISFRKLKGAVKVPLKLQTPAQMTAVTADGDVVWLFATYTLRDAGLRASEFTERLVDDDLITDADDLADPDALSSLVLKHPDRLKHHYKEFVRSIGSSFTLNLTSLALYSGPPLQAAITTYRSRTVRERPEIGAWNPNPAWLGYGDASLGTDRRLKEFNDAFAQYKRHVGTFAPPHHGSEVEWNAELISGFGVDAETAPVCVFGAAGDYGHPSLRALLDVNRRGGSAIIVTEDQASRWTESFTAFVQA